MRGKRFWGARSRSHYVAKVKDYTEYILEPKSELRFEVEDQNNKVCLTLYSGIAEIFGTELIRKKDYEFNNGAKVNIFTFQGCVIHMKGKPEYCYISKKSPMPKYLHSHGMLEAKRTKAEKINGRGPIAMVVGAKDVGKSTLCRILLNYATRFGRKPLYVDTDIGEGAFAVPGALMCMLVERPATIEDGIASSAPLVYHFGHPVSTANSILFKAVVSKMAGAILPSLNANEKIKESGIIINTFPWTKGEGYKNLKHIAEAFEVNIIFVLDNERLYHELMRDMPLFVRIVYLPRSGGVVSKTKSQRNEARDLRIKDYFYGSKFKLYPFSFEMKFSEMKLFRIGAPSLPASCMPIGIKIDDYKTKVVAVTPSQAILHHVLAVSFAESNEHDVIGTNVAGFVCITDLDLKRQVATVLSPQPRPLPHSILLLSELQFLDNYT